MRDLPPTDAATRARPRTAAAFAVLALACLASLSSEPAAAQVTVFREPPSADELRRALGGARGGASAAGNLSEQGVIDALAPRSRTRGIAADGAAAGEAAIATPVAAPAAIALKGNAVELPAVALPVTFDAGSSKVTTQSLPYLEVIAKVMRSEPGVKLTIEGHTDSSGDYRRNMMLSWDRAFGVFRALVDQYGIDPARLQPLGRGPLVPLEGTRPEDVANRRVQFRVSD